MGKRAHLRSQRTRGRRLFILIPLLLAIAAGSLWYVKEYQQQLFDRTIEFFDLGKWRLVQHRDFVRGTIYDRNYKELAVSYEQVSVYANIREIDDIDKVIGPLAALLEESEQTLYNRLSGNSLRIWLAREISQEQEEEIRQLDLSGVFLHKEYVRYHPQRDSGAHLIGFVEKDTGLSGVEHYLDQLQAKYRIENDNIADLPLVGESRPGADGRHLILTLDLKIQQVLDEYLGEIRERRPALRVGALVMDAESGALVGYSQLPSFDSNKFYAHPENVFIDIFDEAIAVPQPFKVLLREVSLLESQPERHLGILPWGIAAEHRKLGVQLQLWERLGAGNRESYDFISTSQDNSSAVAYDGPQPRDFETVPTILTPLQLLTAVTRSVNGGVKVIPHAADRYVIRRNQREYLLDDFAAPLKKDLLYNGVSEETRTFMRDYAQPGPIGSAMLEGKSISYETDQDQKVYTNHNLLMAAIPIRKPELMLMLVSSEKVYGPDKATSSFLETSASRLIAPIAALQKVMKNLADMMKPQERVETNYSISGEDSETSETATKGVSAAELIGIKMPQLKGMSLRKSLRLLQRAEVNVEVQGSGRVTRQKPEAGEMLKPQTSVILYLERDEVDVKPSSGKEAAK
ncbi:MAG: PASTA domain-containing protein [Desulfobacterales bacterium]|nr:PASTA domain-containing protein [Desulfobacterales bacterium]